MNFADAKVVANFLIADFEHEMQTTLRVLERFPTSISTTGRTPSPRPASDSSGTSRSRTNGC